MRKLLQKLDQKYLKVCLYAAVTVILTVVALFILAYSGDFWKTLWTIFTAVLSPIITGLVICYLFMPLIQWIEKHLSKEPRPWTRPAAVAIFYLCVAAIFGFVIVLLFFALKGGIDSIRELNFEAIKEFIDSLYAEFEDVIKSMESQISTSKLPIGQIGSMFTKLIDAIAGFFSGMLFGIIFSIYFMLDEKHLRDYWARVVKVINGQKAYDTMKSIAAEADHVFSGYLRGQFLDALIVGIAASVVLYIAGVPYAVVIGILIGLGNLIPYVGPIVGYGAVVIIGVITGQYDKMVIGIVLIAVIMFVDGNIINPRLLSENIEVHPLLVVAALLAGGAIGGVLGMLIAVPTAAFLKLQFEKILDKKEQADKEEQVDKKESEILQA